MKPGTFLSITGLALATLMTVCNATAAPAIYAINSGGSAYTAADGTVYEADNYFTGGGTSTNNSPVAATNDPFIFQSVRLGNSTYRLPVKNGRYTIKLQFVENYFNAAGKRVFDVAIENTTVLNRLDIFANSGKNVRFDNIFTTDVTDGELTIAFKNAIKDQPIIAGIVVAPEYSGLAIPGTIEAEYYKEGGEGIGYHDTTTANYGGALRHDGVDILANNLFNTYDVGWTAPGEWLAYSVNVKQSGIYAVALRASSGASGTKKFHIEVDGVNVTGTVAFTRADGWQKLFTTPAGTLPLSTNAATLRFVFEDGAPFDIDAITFTPVGPTLLTDIHFADPAFANCVHNMATTFGWLYPADVTSLSCPGSVLNPIRDISGIEIFTNLQTVDFSYNKIFSASFTNHPALSTIGIPHNQTLKTIDVSGAPALRLLDLWQNQLTTINLDNNPLLYWLSVGENPLTPATKAYIHSIAHITELQIDP